MLARDEARAGRLAVDGSVPVSETPKRIDALNDLLALLGRLDRHLAFRPQPAADRFTLRRAYEDHLRSPLHARRTVEAYHETLTHWEATEVSIPLDPADPLRRERLHDPDVRAIDCRTLGDFKKALLARVGVNTVRKTLTQTAAVLNMLGPPSSRNPEALGILPVVPFVRKPAERHRRPRIVKADELQSLYAACHLATWPRCEVPPADWWRALLVTIYNVAFRRLDYLALRWSEVDLRAGIVSFDADKTEKPATLPLHPIVVEHLDRIRTRRALVFPWRYRQRTADPIDRLKKSLYRQWHRIEAEAGAGVTAAIVPHDLRRTCGSELFWKNPAAAQEVLQHASIVTTQRAYADVASPITRDLMLAKPQPFGWHPSQVAQ